MADTTQISNLDIVKINSTYINTPVDAELSGVCLISEGDSEGLHTYYSANDVESDFGHDTYVTNFANNYFNDGGPMFQVITYTNDDENSEGAVGAVRKYYDNGSEYFAFLSADNKQQTAIDLSNLVENQSNKVIFIDIPTNPNQTPDFSAYAPIKNNKSTVLVSLPAIEQTEAHYQVVSKILGARANEAPNASLLSIHDLSNVTPQDKYSFQVNQEKPYKDAGILTYAYRNGIPMLTGANSASGYQISNMITRDYLNYNIKKNVTNYIINNNPTYDANGLNAIGDIIRAALQDAQEKGYIERFNVNQPNASQISEAKKESGELDGLGYSWAPTNNITNAVFQQGIQLPSLS